MAINNHACYIWIVNDITDSDTSFFFLFFSFSPLLFQDSICKEVCVCVCV